MQALVTANARPIMKREAKLLLQKSKDSLILAIELFNRPSEVGRTHSVLILLDHAFEMLLKAGILSRGGKIQQKNKKGTIGFDACLRNAFTDNSIKFLELDEFKALQALNGLRDAAQHHLLEISENQLYLHVQSGVTLYSKILSRVFSEDLADKLPKRVLPVSLSLPADIEIFSIKKSKKSGNSSLRKGGVESKLERGSNR